MEDWVKEMELAAKLASTRNLEEYARVLGRVLAPQAVVFDGQDSTLSFLTRTPKSLAVEDLPAWLERNTFDWEGSAHKLCNFNGYNPDTWAPIIADALPGVPVFFSACSCCSSYQPVTLATRAA